jgi:hypothetical protein
MRILILAPNYRQRVNWGHQLWRDEIARQHDVVFHGQGHPLQGYTDVPKLVKDCGPFDVITVGENSRHFENYEGIAECEALKVCFCGDYYGSKANNYDRLIKKHGIDLVFLSSPDYTKNWDRRNVSSAAKAYCLPFVYSVDSNYYKNFGAERDVDVMCVYGLFNAIYPKRPELQHIVANMPCRTIVGNWTEGDYKRQRYIDLLNRSRIFVSVNGVGKQLTMKYFESMACGALFLTDRPLGFEYWGLEEDKHFVFYRDFREMQSKVKYYLEHEQGRKRITRRADQFIRDNFTNERWVGKWTKIIGEEVLERSKRRSQMVQ